MTQTKGKLDPGAFSDVDAAGETAHFVAYLDRAATALKGFRRVGDEMLGLRPGERVLDVGCGTGDATAQLAAKVAPGGIAVGVDYSATMIAEAHKRAAPLALSIEFKTGDAKNLPFPDNYFDACTAERLFVHLGDPAAVLKEMLRVLRPGGRIVVRESDLDMVAIDASDRATTRAVCAFFADSVRNGWIGRQLSSLFQAVGLEEVALQPYPLVTRDFGVFNAMLPFEDTAHTAATNGTISAEAAAAWIAELHERDAQGRFFACILGFIATGTKPAL